MANENIEIALLKVGLCKDAPSEHERMTVQPPTVLLLIWEDNGWRRMRESLRVRLDHIVDGVYVGMLIQSPHIFNRYMDVGDVILFGPEHVSGICEENKDEDQDGCRGFTG